MLVIIHKMGLLRFIEKFIIGLSHLVSDPLLDNPYMFNYVRFFLAGNQNGMKNFIKLYLEKNKCKTIIDFCSGTGDFVICKPLNSSYSGVDLNPRFVSYAKKKYRQQKQAKFIIDDVIFSKKLYKKKYDAVLLVSAVHHFSDDELKILLPKIKKITKKIVIVADIIPDPPHLLQKFFVKIDRGRYIRPKEQKLKIFKKNFKVIAKELIPTRSAVQFGFVCKIK